MANVIITNSFVTLTNSMLTARSENATYPKVNCLKQLRLMDVFRAADVTAADYLLKINFGAAQSVAAIALLNVNFDHVQIQGNASDVWTSPSYAGSSLSVSQNKYTGRYNIFIPLTAFNYQYLRIYIPAGAVLKSGSLTQANCRISAVDGTAFVDTDDATFAADLVANLGKYLVITDSAGKKAKAWIKAQGTGETLGAEILSNVGFETAGAGGLDIFANWVEYSGALGTSEIIRTTAAGEFRSGSAACKMIVNSQGSIWVYQEITEVLSALHKVAVYSRGDGTRGGRYGVYNADDATWLTAIKNLATGTDYTLDEGYFTALSVNKTYRLYFYASATTGVGATCYFDDISVKQITAPSANGVTLVSIKDGTTYNFAEVETGFNYNDVSGYDYEIYDAPLEVGTSQGEWQIGTMVIMSSASALSTNISYGFSQQADEVIESIGGDIASVDDTLEWKGTVSFGNRNKSDHEATILALGRMAKSSPVLFYLNDSDTSEVYLCYRESTYSLSRTASNVIKGNSITYREIARFRR